MEKETMVTAEEILDTIKHSVKSTPRNKVCGNRARNNLFNEVKIKMVMRIYGVSRTRAMEIIAVRANKKRAAESKSASNRSMKQRTDDGFMSAEDFFGKD